VSTSSQPEPANRRVRVWFGEHTLVEHVADPTRAARFEAAMRRRFASLRVSNDPVRVSNAELLNKFDAAKGSSAEEPPGHL
jgi:hypothetical protein